jgi:hypothetical protein
LKEIAAFKAEGPVSCALGVSQAKQARSKLRCKLRSSFGRALHDNGYV